jgi:CRP-like cAMP-binding protein
MIMIMIMSDFALQEFWVEHGRERCLAAGQTLFRSGDVIELLHRVEHGLIALVRPLSHGADLILQRARGGSVIAEASLFAETYHCDAVAIEPAGVRSVPLRSVKLMLGRRADLAGSLTRHLALEVQRARARAEIVSLKTVSLRLDAWLALNHEGMPPRGRWREIAAEIGVSPEALYRELAKRRHWP